MKVKERSAPHNKGEKISKDASKDVSHDLPKQASKDVAKAEKNAAGATTTPATATATPSTRPTASTAPAGGPPVDYSVFLAQLGVKDRSNIERHVATCEAEPDPAHAINYRRLLCVLGGLAPHATKTHGQQAVQFYIPDGKYRMQVFALEDQRDGQIVIYCEDVLDAALKSGLLRGPHEVAEQNNSYRIKGSIDSVRADRLDGKSANPAPFYKDMLGWNRRAIRLSIPATAPADAIAAVETLCGLAARKWAKA
jgi:hypothetical protein